MLLRLPARIRRLLGAFILLTVVALTAGSCAQDVGLIDRTQPNLLAKTLFEGEWFMRRTVIDVPYDAGYTFIGEQDEATRVRWEIQADHLIAWRVTPQIEGTYDAAPSAVFAIKAHVDLTREYNSSTGEQTNVLTENTSDRVWYEREYIRVDWSKNLVTNFNFYVEHLDQDPVAFHVEADNDPNRLLVGVKGADGGWTDYQDMEELRQLDEGHYLDVVTRIFVKPEQLAWEDWYGNLVYEPACWYYGNFDCAPAQITVRSSFLRVDAAVTPDYEPLWYPDNEIARGADDAPIRVRWNQAGDLEPLVDDTDAPGQATGSGEFGDPDDLPTNPFASTSDVVRVPWFDKFGYFRVERYGYDELYEETEESRLYWMTRFNIWDKTRGDDGELLPYADRGIRKIIYYLSPDFPEYMLPAAEETAAQWNKAFRDTVGTLTNDPDPPDVFELRLNSQATDAETGEVTNRGEAIGDLRYNHLWLVSEPTRAGLLGYGPSAVDPLTGETFSASAFVYGGPIQSYAATARDIVELINGHIEPEEFAIGENIKSYLSALGKGGTRHEYRTKDAVQEFARGHKGAGPPEAPSPGGKPKATPKKRPSKSAVYDKPGIDKFFRPGGWSSSRLSAVRDSPFEDMLSNDPMLIGLKGLGLITGGVSMSDLPESVRARVSAIYWASPAHRRESLERVRGFARRNIMMATFFDDAVAGLALQLKDTDPAEIQQKIAAHVFGSTAEHEVGHTLGLRHNFEATTDALNFHSEFWDLKGADGEPLQPMTEPQSVGRMREYQYSSIMDYHGRFNTDTQGLGPYDYAAIKFGYGGLVEVFETKPVEPMLDLQDYGDGSYGREFTLDEALRDFRHYTRIPSMLGGIDAIHDRKTIPYTDDVAALMGSDQTSLVAQLTGQTKWKYWEVPYRFCSDEYVEGTSTCAMFDLGADEYEIVTDAMDRYRNYYWFNSFRRDRVIFDEWDYMDSIYWRYFSYIKTIFNHWVVGQWFDADTYEWLRGDAAKWGVEDVPWTEAADGGLALTAAVMDGMAFFQEVIATPEPGAYWRDFGEGYWWAFDSEPVQTCPEGWSWDYDYWCADINIGLGQGRYFESIYDVDSGYYFYDRMKWVGSFYDKLLALEALTSPDTYFLGVDTSGNLDQWAISMYASFPNEIQQLFVGVAADRFDLFAGTVDESGQYVPPDPFADSDIQTMFATRGGIDPSTSFTVQLYALWYGMAWLNANFDNTFNDTAKIWLKGSGEAIELADDSELIEFADPFNNRVYVTSRSLDPKIIGIGATMLEQAQGFLADYDAAAAEPGVTPEDLDYYKWRVTNVIENVEVVRGLYDLYGYLYF